MMRNGLPDLSRRPERRVFITDPLKEFEEVVVRRGGKTPEDARKMLKPKVAAKIIPLLSELDETTNIEARGKIREQLMTALKEIDQSMGDFIEDGLEAAMGDISDARYDDAQQSVSA